MPGVPDGHIPEEAAYGKYLDGAYTIGVKLTSCVVHEVYVSMRYPFQDTLLNTSYMEVELKVRTIENEF